MKFLALWAIHLFFIFALIIYAENDKSFTNAELLKNNEGIKILPDLPPIGMSSLTFVFDRTGSMNDDLKQVRHGAKGIFETVMRQRKRFIYNYVLVLFHDPGNFIFLYLF